MISIDIIVIGAGAAGLALASSLAPAARVAVLEQEGSAGAHATGRSAAIFVDSYGDAVVRALSALSRPHFAAPPFSHDGPPLLTSRGLLHVARAGTGALGHDDRREAFPKLTADEARALVPILRRDAIAFAHHEAGAADIDVHALLTGWQRRIRMHGGQILFGAPVAAAERIGGVWQIAVGDRRLAAPIVVNAAGAWADMVAPMFAARPLGLQPLRRTAATLPPIGRDTCRWPMTIDMEESVYFKPEGGSLMVSPADSTPCAPHDAFAEELDVAVAMARFEELTTVTVQRVAAQWAGLRTVSGDGRPVMGFDPVAEGFFWLAGQGGFGIQTAFGMADLAAAILSGANGDVPDALVTALAPGRFTAETRSGSRRPA